MGMMRFEFTAEPSLEKVAFALAEYADEVKDWSPAFRVIEKLFYQHEKNLFRTIGKGRSGNQWPQWAALSEREPPKGGYKAYKHRKRPGRPILVWDGTLRRAATGGPGAIKGRITPTSMLVGIDPSNPVAVVARAHTTGREPYLPSRPPIRFDPDVSKRGVSFGYAASQIIQNFLVLKRKEAMAKVPGIEERITMGDTAGKSRKRIKTILRKPWR